MSNEEYDEGGVGGEQHFPFGNLEGNFPVFGPYQQDPEEAARFRRERALDYAVRLSEANASESRAGYSPDTTLEIARKFDTFLESGE
jgi:hypothetical protein